MFENQVYVVSSCCVRIFVYYSAFCRKFYGIESLSQQFVLFCRLLLATIRGSIVNN